jgi:Heat shock protein
MNLKATIVLASLIALMSSCGVSNSKVSDRIKAEWAIEEVCGKTTESAQNPAVIIFRNGGKFDGNASVNSFFGKYKIEGKDNLKFDNVGMTRMMGASMDIDDAVFKAIRNTSSIEIDGDFASVKDENGDVVMRLRRK